MTIRRCLAASALWALFLLPAPDAAAAGQITLTQVQADAVKCALHVTTRAEADDFRSTAKDAASGLLAADDPKLGAVVQAGITRLSGCGLPMSDPMLMQVFSAYTQLLLGGADKLKP